MNSSKKPPGLPSGSNRRAVRMLMVLLLIAAAGTVAWFASVPVSTLSPDAGEPAGIFDASSVIFLSDRDGPVDLYALDLQGGIQRVTRTPEREYSPTLAPDGAAIVYAVETDARWVLRLLEQGHAQSRALFSSQHQPSDIVFAPSGDAFAFLEHRTGTTTAVLVYEFATASVVQLDPHADMPFWFPRGVGYRDIDDAGSRFVVQSRTSPSGSYGDAVPIVAPIENVSGLPGNAQLLHAVLQLDDGYHFGTVTLNGEQTTTGPLIGTVVQKIDPVLHPHATQLLYLMAYEGRTDLFSSQLDGSGSERIADGVVALQWAQDGTRYAFVTYVDTEPTVNVRSVGGEIPETVIRNAWIGDVRPS